MNETEKEEVMVQPCLVVVNTPEDGMVVMLNNHEFDTPAIWGIVVADIVAHIVNAYAADGVAWKEAREQLLQTLLCELDHPTARAFRLNQSEPWGEE